MKSQGPGQTTCGVGEVNKTGEDNDEKGNEKADIKWNLELCKTVHPEIFNHNMENNNNCRELIMKSFNMTTAAREKKQSA